MTTIVNQTGRATRGSHSRKGAGVAFGFGVGLAALALIAQGTLDSERQAVNSQRAFSVEAWYEGIDDTTRGYDYALLGEGLAIVDPSIHLPLVEGGEMLTDGVGATSDEAAPRGFAE